MTAAKLNVPTGADQLRRRTGPIEDKYGKLDWRVGLLIAEEVAKESFCKFDSKLKAMEIAIRVGFAYLTGGIVAAPLEGFIELKLKKRKDGNPSVTRVPID